MSGMILDRVSNTIIQHYLIYQGDSFVHALYSVDTEQQSIQSNRAAEQTAAEQSAGHMTRALLSRDGSYASAQTSVWAL